MGIADFKILVIPDIISLIAIRRGQVNKALFYNILYAEGNIHFLRTLVEQADCKLFIFKWLYKHIRKTVCFNSAALNTKRILINGNKFFV